MRGIGKTVADDKVRVVTQVPEALEVGGIVLAIAVEKKYPVDRRRQMDQRMAQRGRLAVMPARQREDFSPGLGGEMGRRIATAIVDDGDGKARRHATAHDLADGGGFIARRNQHRGHGAARGYRVVGGPVGGVRNVRQPRGCRLD